jgi:hypothetical protein
VNGFRLSYQQRSVQEQKFNFGKKLVVIAIFASIIVATPYFLVYAFPKDTVEIDGYFMDWIKAQVYRDTPDSDNPDIALTGYAMKFDSRGSFFYIATEGSMLQGSDGGADGFYIFIDRDHTPSTGYSVRGLGADDMIAVYGWNGSVVDGELYSFDDTVDNDNFGGFMSHTEVKVATAGGEMEIGTPLSLDGDARLVICSRHTDLPIDWSDVSFRSRGTSAVVTQYFGMPSVLASGTDVHAITLDIYSKGPAAFLDSLSFDLLGNITPASITASDTGSVLGSSTGREIRFTSPMALSSRVHRLVITADLPYALGGSFGLQLNSSSLQGPGQEVSWTVENIQTGSKVAYLGFAPSRIVVDGAFADWTSRAPIQDRLWDAYSNKTLDNRTGDVDISIVKLASTASVASFYMAVNGTMLGGSSVPSSMVRFVAPPTPSSNVTNVTPPLFGADFAFAFIDADHNMSTGFEVGGSEIALAVAGKGNSIMSSKLLRFGGYSWVETGDIAASVDSYQLEMSAAYSAMGLTPGQTYTITFMAQDWSGRMDDISLPLPARLGSGARSYPGIVINEIYSRAPPGGGNDWLEIFNTGSTPITIGGWQLWLDGLLIYTYPTVTIQPGQFYVINRLSFGKSVNYMLTDASGNIVDQITTPDWQGRSYGRTGSAPFSQWSLMTPTPGAPNVGQIIPELNPVLASIAIVPIVLMAIRRARTRTPRQPKDLRGESA